MVGVRFRPGAAPAVLGVPASELVDQSFATAELWGSAAEALGERVFAAEHRAAINGREHLLKSVGRAAPGVELKIHEPDEEGVGEVWARCPHSFLVDAEGWQRTGDIGHIDDEGFLYLVGRRGDKIIRGGENVYPLEVEQVLATHPDIQDVVVVGIPERRLGETIKAFIVPTPGAAPDAEELRRYARERLAGFKVPVMWQFLEAMPRNANGKIMRRKLPVEPVD